MINLEKPLQIVEGLHLKPNLTGLLSDHDLDAIGEHCWRGYQADEQTRQDWLARNEVGMKLALQITEIKTTPWENCSNVAFPLVTVAALQFHARAYPTLLNGGKVVECITPDGAPPEMVARAAGATQVMNRQILELDESWEEGTDRMLLNYAIAGCAFKKTIFRGTFPHSKFVPAVNLVMDYFAASVETCRRKTEILAVEKADIISGSRMDIPLYRDVTKESWFTFPAAAAPTPASSSGTQAIRAPEYYTTLASLEQHCWLDLDNDGLEEPYTVLIEATTHKVLRITARWDSDSAVLRNASRQIVSIRATEHYTKYAFIPNPDGSVYDLGFGVLLGPLNASVSSAINQLIDSGTMSVAAGGFLGRGAKIRSGVTTFKPFEWKRVDATGDDLAKSIFPLPVREPSQVLFSLLGLLIEYTNRVSGTTETMVGENPGQNTPAETSRNLVQQGMMVYAAIFKRAWRSAKQEFRKMYLLNGLYGSARERVLFTDDPSLVVPAADPNIISDSERVNRAMMLASRAAAVPGYDPNEVETFFLSAIRISNPKRFYRGFDPAQVPKDPKLQIAEMKAQLEAARLEFDQQSFLAQLLETQRMNQAQLIKTQAEVTHLLAQAEDARDNREIVRMQTALSALKLRDDTINSRIEQMIKLLELESEPDKKRIDSGPVRELVGAPGNPGLDAAPPAPAGGAPAGMGSGQLPL
jgi:chaperonin GroES